MPYNTTTFSQPGVRGVGSSTVRAATPAAGSFADYQTQLANNAQQASQHGQGNPIPVGQQIGGRAGYQTISGNAPNWTANYGASGRQIQPPSFNSGSNTYNPWSSPTTGYDSQNTNPSLSAGSPPSFSQSPPLKAGYADIVGQSGNSIWAGGTQGPSQTPEGYPINNFGGFPTPSPKPLLPGQNNPDGSQQGGYGSPPFIPQSGGGVQWYRTSQSTEDQPSQYASNGGDLGGPFIPGSIGGDVMFGSGVPGAVGGDAGGSIGQWPTTPQMVANGVDPRFAFDGSNSGNGIWAGGTQLPQSPKLPQLNYPINNFSNSRPRIRTY